MVAQYDLGLQIFYHAVNLTDEFLSKLAQDKRQAPCLQKIVATSVLLAVKFNHKHYKQYFNIDFLCHDQLSRDDLLSAELAVLKELDFNLAAPTQQDVHLHLQKYLKIRDILTDEASAA